MSLDVTMAEKSKFEDVLDIIGHIGVMQWVIIGFSILQESAAGLGVYYLIFNEGSTPDWQCSNGGNGSSDSEYTNTSNPCPLTEDFCGNVTFDAQYTSIITDWNLVCNRQYLGKMTVSLLLMGLGIGTVFAGQLADVFGRRKVLLGSWTMIMVTHALLGVMPTYQAYLGMRIINGMAIGSIAAIACVLPSEYIGSTWRVVVSQRCGWRLGTFVLVGLAYAFRKWQHLAFACAAWSVPFIPLAWFFMPESARWSIQKGRFDEAMYWIKKIAKANRKPCPDMALLHQIAQAEREEYTKAKRFTYIDLFRTRKYAIRTSIVMFGWFGLSLTEYGLVTMASSLTGDVYTNLALMGTFNFFFRLSAQVILNMKWFGRVRGFALYAIFAVCCVFTVMILDLVPSDNPEAVSKAKTWILIITFGGMSGAWSSVFMFCCELYPTLLRGLSSSIANIANRIGGVIAPQIVLLASVTHPSVTFIVLGCANTISVILHLIFIPETLDKPLPEDLPIKKRGNDHDLDDDTELDNLKFIKDSQEGNNGQVSC